MSATIAAALGIAEGVTGPSYESTLQRSAYLFVLPATALIFLLIVLPVATVLYLSVTDYTLTSSTMSFIGLSNYLTILSERETRTALLNTVTYAVIVVPSSVALGLILALLVHRRGRSRRFYELVFFLPVTSTMVAMAVVWQYLLHGRIGPINALLGLVGLPPIDFLTDPGIALYALAGIGIWQLAGFTMVLFLAGLTAIPKELYEAAALDGADSGVDKFLVVTWPLLAPTTLFVVITTSITAFQVFDTVAVLTQGGPMQSTQVLLYKTYQEAFQYFEIGFASALTVIFLIIILAFSALQFVVADRRIHYGA